MHFAKLRITGFKSFVDQVELSIEPGITGIVGPNGCGKSNIVDALRWTMGEGSARRMRGAEMDDVIFAGSGGRPPRNVAEVVVKLENTGRRAPAPFDGYSEIEVSRRIDRASGSSYRVNGHEARARDVQLLFADFASGAQSAAMVTQGRVGALIDARPSERRSFLEEAAGITGLEQRRQEAERRIDAAAANLARVDEIAGGLAAQASALRRQAKQAARYRALSEQIRAAERDDLRSRWLRAKEAAEAADAGRIEAARRVAELASAADRADQDRARAASALPTLRKRQEAATATTRDLAEEERAARTELLQIEAALAQGRRELAALATDLEREQRSEQEATEAEARSRASRERLTRENAEAGIALAGAEVQLSAAELSLRSAESDAETRVAALSAEETRHTAASARRSAELAQHKVASDRQRALAAAAESARRNVALAEAASPPPAALGAAEQARHEAEHAVAVLESQQAEAAPILAEAEATEGASRCEAEACAARLTAIDAEIRALAPLAQPRGPQQRTILHSLQAASGSEPAISAALGDTIEASLSPEAARSWRRLTPLSSVPAAPADCRALAVEAPVALARRFAWTWVAPDLESALRLQPALLPGQELVTPDGSLVRWDGFVARAGSAASSASVTLAQRNRLALLRRECQPAIEARDASAAAYGEARNRTEQARSREGQIRRDLTDATRLLRQATSAEAETARSVAGAGARIGVARDHVARLEADLAMVTQERAALPPIGEPPDELPLVQARRAVEAAREKIKAGRQVAAAARDRRDRLRHGMAVGQGRLESLAVQERSWTERGAASSRQYAVLALRRSKREGEQAAIADRPASLARKVEDSGRRQADAALEEAASRATLDAAERELAEKSVAAETAAASVATAREVRARADAEASHVVLLLEDLADEIDRRLDMTPQALAAEASVKAGELKAEETTARYERLKRERDTVGPVNLAAERDLAEIEGRIAALAAEHEDVSAALDKLRQGLQSLNREGRARLMTAFGAINGHFGRLFTRLFEGGDATLSLTDSGDPLSAGLEIMARPPGKRLQALSLLSGGERALTALALLFALFLTNPAPLCVLDEVDAPLDDANVDRFCRLLEEIGRETGTRFLVVTHHRVTMSRMHRLYGVTMVEDGVSQLVSVDLVGAEALRQAG